MIFYFQMAAVVVWTRIATIIWVVKIPLLAVRVIELRSDVGERLDTISGSFW